MQNLLKTGNVRKEQSGLKVDLYHIIGEARPKINEVNAYRWALEIRGSNKYHIIEELRVDFSFVNQIIFPHINLIDYIPKRETTDITELTLSVPGGFISVKIPIREEKIKTEVTKSKIEWIFNDVDLSESETMTKVFEGVVIAEFFPQTIDTKINIEMNVIPIFSKRKILFGKEKLPSPPKIDASEVKMNCTEIIPGDPVRGIPDLNRPDNERIFVSRYIIDQGILEKGIENAAVRNVSLRARTLSMLFEKLRTGLPENYYKLIKDAGEEVGKNFIGELGKILGHMPTIEEWIDYDSSAGMGRFKMSPEKDAVIVKNSFNAYEIKSNKPACIFLEGYFKGILQEIFRKPKIIVTETSCIAKGDKECVFKIE